MTAFATIERFMGQRRLALVGASRDPRGFSRAMLRELVAHGYDVVPVNRGVAPGELIDGRAAYPSVDAVPGELGGAILVLPSSEAAEATRDALVAKVPRLWYHRGAGPGASSDEALELARRAGIEVIVDECPLMYLANAGAVHRLHAGVRAAAGHVPLRAPAVRPGRASVAALALVQAAVALPALPVGAGLIGDPTGGSIGMHVDSLAGSPLTSYLLPGLFLFVVNGLAQLGALALTLRRRPSAGVAALVLGLALVVWIAVQLAWYQGGSLLQPMYGAIGLVEMGLGVHWLLRAAPAVRGPSG